MPTVARFDGLKIKFYYDEHPPPHFHATFGEFEAQIDIGTLTVIEGDLPMPQLRKLRDWAAPRLARLAAAWDACRADAEPGTIP